MIPDEQQCLPFPIVKESGGLPIKCRACWWREGRGCYNESFGPIPTKLHTYTNADGIEKSYNARTGHEITDDHFRTCQEQQGRKSKAEVWARVFGAVEAT